MTYPNALSAPPRFQWEPSSGSPAASQANNCGVTCATFIAGFYRDAYYGIEATRRLVMQCCDPTNAWQQKDMLAKRGVPATVYEITSIEQLRQLVGSGQRPIIIGILMSRVSAGIRGHPFTGWHAVVVMASGVNAAGLSGFWVMDPNFSPPGGIRPDPSHGKRFYPDGTMNYAFIQNNPSWAVVPNAAKAVSTPAPAPSTVSVVAFNAGVNGVNIRRAPDARSASNIYAVARPTGIYRLADGVRLSSLGSGFALAPGYPNPVRGADGALYWKTTGYGLKDKYGRPAYLYVQSQFMHRG